jgi:hypothetical protein
MADPDLAPILLWGVLPVTLVVMGACLALWRGRRGWVVLQAVVRDTPDPGGPSEIAWRDAAGEVQVSRIMLPNPKGPPRPGTIIALSHPPGRPEAMQPGTPGPLLGAAVAAGLVALLCLSMLLGW